MLRMNNWFNVRVVVFEFDNYASKKMLQRHNVNCEKMIDEFVDVESKIT